MKCCVTITISINQYLKEVLLAFLWHCDRMNNWATFHFHFHSLSLQTLKFQYSYHHIRLARHQSSSIKLIRPTEFKNISTRCWIMARRHTDHFYMDCWVERIFHKHHIIGDTARQVQVSGSFSFISFISWRCRKKLVNWPFQWPCVFLSFSFNKMINDHFSWPSYSS